IESGDTTMPGVPAPDRSTVTAPRSAVTVNCAANVATVAGWNDTGTVVLPPAAIVDAAGWPASNDAASVPPITAAVSVTGASSRLRIVTGVERVSPVGVGSKATAAGVVLNTRSCGSLGVATTKSVALSSLSWIAPSAAGLRA